MRLIGEQYYWHMYVHEDFISRLVFQLKFILLKVLSHPSSDRDRLIPDNIHST